MVNRQKGRHTGNERVTESSSTSSFSQIRRPVSLCLPAFSLRPYPVHYHLLFSLCCLSSVASSVPPLHCAQCPHRHRSSSIERNVRYTCHRFLSKSSHSSSSHIRFAVVRQLHSAASPASFSLASAICSDCASSVSLSANCYHRSEEQTGELALGFAFFLSSFISRQPSKEWRQAVQN